MYYLLVDDDVIINRLLGNKRCLARMNNMFQDRSQPRRDDFGDNLEDHIAKRYRAKVVNMGRMTRFRNESQEGMVMSKFHPVIPEELLNFGDHIRTNDVPVGNIEGGRHAKFICLCFEHKILFKFIQSFVRIV